MKEGSNRWGKYKNSILFLANRDGVEKNMAMNCIPDPGAFGRGFDGYPVWLSRQIRLENTALVSLPIRFIISKVLSSMSLCRRRIALRKKRINGPNSLFRL